MTNFTEKKKEDLSVKQQVVVDAAIKAIETSYSPYSKFAVGAAILLKDGTIITGSNQENMAYPSGTCAERSALFAFGSQALEANIDILAVFAKNHNSTEITTGSPCGACRQVMLEYELKQQESFEVIFYHDSKFIVTPSARYLLPFHFHLSQINE